MKAQCDKCYREFHLDGIKNPWNTFVTVQVIPESDDGSALKSQKWCLSCLQDALAEIEDKR